MHTHSCSINVTIRGQNQTDTHSMINTLLGKLLPVIVPTAIEHLLVVRSLQLLFRLVFEESPLSHHGQRRLKCDDLATGSREKRERTAESGAKSGDCDWNFGI